MPYTESLKWMIERSGYSCYRYVAYVQRILDKLKLELIEIKNLIIKIRTS